MPVISPRFKFNPISLLLLFDVTFQSIEGLDVDFELNSLVVWSLFQLTISTVTSFYFAIK